MEELKKHIAKMIDHALLLPILDDNELEEGIELCRKYNVASVCIKPYYVSKAYEMLKDSDVKVCTVIGFPHGSNKTEVKVLETECAINDGATEVDMVVNIGKVKSHDWEYVKNDILQVTKKAHSMNANVKVIFENCYLNDDEKIKLCNICQECNVEFIKTSTGFGTEGATINDLKLMIKNVSANIGVKASGGIKDLDRAVEVKELGCKRIGTSSTKNILDGGQSTQNY